MLKKQIKAHFNRASQTYDQHATLQNHVGEDLLTRLSMVKLAPQTCLDIGTSTGGILPAFTKRFPNAYTVGVDIAHAMLQQAQHKLCDTANVSLCCSDGEALPFQSESFDLILSNLTLQWCDTARMFAEMYRVLKPGGLIFISTLGPASLQEIACSWQDIDTHKHTHDFIDLHHIGDAFVKNRFADPVMEMDTLTLHYPTLTQLLQDIKGIGAQNIHHLKPQGLMGKQRWQQFVATYAARFQTTENYFPLTYEIIYGHAWKPTHPYTAKTEDNGEAYFPLHQLRTRRG